MTSDSDGREGLGRASDGEFSSSDSDRVASARRVFEDEVFPAELNRIRERRKTVGLDTKRLDDFLGPSEEEAASEPSGTDGPADSQQRRSPVTRIREGVGRLLRRGRDESEAPSKGPRTDLELTGMSLSGGGVRSASFNVGILQVFAEHGVLRCVDYLSTVSGGGYIGCSLSTMLNTSEINLKDKFPILHKWGEQEAGVFRHLRNGANYLYPGEPLEKLRIPSLLFVGMVSNLLLLAPYLLLIAALFAWPHSDGLSLLDEIHEFHSGAEHAGEESANGDETGHWGASKWAWGAVFLCVLFFPRTQHAKFWSRLANVGTRTWRWIRRSKKEKAPKSRLLGRSLYERFFGVIFLFACAVTLIEAQPYLIRFLVGTDDQHDVKPWLVAFGILAAAVIILMLIVSASFARTSSPAAGRAALWGFGFVGPALLWLLFAGVCIWRPFKRDRISLNHWHDDLIAWEPPWAILGWFDSLGEAILAMAVRWPAYWETQLFFTAALVTLLLGKLLVDVNDSSLNSVYRNRLSRGFLFYVDGDGRVVQDFDHDKLPPADEIRLSQLNRPGSSAPYHLINATLNVQKSEAPTARNRKADFFVFSKEYTGGPLTSYCKTKHLEKIDPGLDLGTAMAISGAAASANMGSGTVGALVFILALLNVRLGYWLVNPSFVRARNPRLLELGMGRWFQPRVGPLHFLREIIGFLDATGKNVYLSDGGHLENLGVFELLRRRCRFVIVSDAEADPEMRFGGLARLIRIARVDFGCNIDIDLDDLRKTDGNSSRHCVMGKIDYGRGQIGHLLYIKLSVTGDEAETIREYREAHSAFPHEPTTDQFFTEAQFEAYRHLGWHIAKRLIERATGERGSSARIENADEFFKNLRESLKKRVDRPDRELELHRELSAIEARFADVGLSSYSFDVYPELGVAAKRPTEALTGEDQRKILHLCNQQLLLMERIFLTCRLDDPLRRKSPENQSWLALFRRWARVAPFQQTWAINVGRQDADFRHFCRVVLKLEADINFEGEGEEPKSWTAYLEVKTRNGAGARYPVAELSLSEPSASGAKRKRARLFVDDRYYRRGFVERLRQEARSKFGFEIGLPRAAPLDLLERHRTS